MSIWFGPLLECKFVEVPAGTALAQLPDAVSRLVAGASPPPHDSAEAEGAIPGTQLMESQAEEVRRTPEMRRID
eukprot:1195308-Prorocentrum_minimum.AAC.10